MSAALSVCGMFRWRLDRPGPGSGATLVIMVNPSTADAETDDHTIRKLRGFGERYEWGRLMVGNLYALRTKDIKTLRVAPDRLGGPDFDVHMRAMLSEATNPLIVAWGASGKMPVDYMRRIDQILGMANVFGHQPMSLGPPLQDGHPAHPLMLGYDRAPQIWIPPNA